MPRNVLTRHEPHRYDDEVARRYSDTIRRHACWALLASGVASCGGADRPTVDVLAASSYTDVSGALETLLEDELDVDIRFSFGSSGTFVEQLNQGSPASVVLTANEATMRRLESAGLVDPSVAISRNELIIVTADTTIGQSIDSLDDLAAATDAVVVVCASSAPCGAATDQLLARSGLTLSPASREPNVRATLTKVILGEADAAIVYRTDAQARPDIRAVEIDGTVDVIGRAAAVVDDDDGKDIIAILTSNAARAILAEAGFQSP